MALSPKKKRWLWVGAIAMATLVSLVLTVQRMLLFPSGASTPQADAGDGLVGLQRLWLQIDGGRVEAWLLPGHGVDAEHPGPLVVFAHGNAELIDQWPANLEHYRERGISVLLPEYRGYGRSSGSPSESGIVADFVAFYDLAVARPEIDADRVVLHGRSLGGGVVGALARQRPSAAIIVQSTFTSISALAWEKWFVPPFFILDRFDTLAAARAYEGPMLIVHGRGDTLIPLAHAEALHEAATNAQLVVFDGGHNDTPPSWDALWTEVDAFLARVGVTP